MPIASIAEITEQHIKEDLSRAYIQALAGQAGVIVRIGEESHDYGIDGDFEAVQMIGGKRKQTGCPIKFQLKATVAWKEEAEQIEYELDVATYNHLISLSSNRVAAPIVLVVLCLPPDRDDWAQFKEDVLELKKCCYYKQLVGSPVNKADTSKEKVFIRSDHRLTPEVLRELLKKANNGELK